MRKENLIKQKMEYYRAENIADKLGVSKATIYRWVNSDNYSFKKFIEFLYLMDIDPGEYIKENTKKDGK